MAYDPSNDNFDQGWDAACDELLPRIKELEQQLAEAAARIKHLEDGGHRRNEDILQTLGKALGYPWFKDDQKNFPGAKEADGVCTGDHVAESIAAEAAKVLGEAKADQAALRMLGELGFCNRTIIISDSDTWSLSNKGVWSEGTDLRQAIENAGRTNDNGI